MSTPAHDGSDNDHYRGWRLALAWGLAILVPWALIVAAVVLWW